MRWGLVLCKHTSVCPRGRECHGQGWGSRADVGKTEAVGTKRLGVTWWREVQPWPEGSSAGEGSLVSFWGPLGVCLEGVGLDDDASGLPDMGAYPENPRTHTYSHLHAHTGTQAHAHAHTGAEALIDVHGVTGTRACRPVHTSTHIWQCTHTYTSGNAGTRLCTPVHGDEHTCTHMHSHAHTCTYVHAYL